MRKKELSQRLIDIYATVGKNIERLRGKMFMEVLGEKAGLSRQTISAIEKGAGCNLKTLIQIADALEVSLADLFITIKDREEVVANYKHILLMKMLKESEVINKQ